MNIFHVIIPHSRPGLENGLCERLGMNRHCIVDPRFITLEPPPDCFDICYWKINRALDEYLRNEYFQNQGNGHEHWFHFLCDDDLVSPGFYDRLDTSGTNIHHITMRRGQHDKGMHHECSTLHARPENRCTGKIGLEQLIVRDYIMQNRRFNENHHCADGFMAERLAAEVVNWSYHGDGPTDPIVFFNAFEPGRWDHPC